MYSSSKQSDVTQPEVTQPRRPRSLGQRSSFWVAAAVAAIALWTSAAPTITYPLYAAQWHLEPSVTTAIFSVYPVALVIVLVFFGNVSDYIGRRAAILLGLTASLAGVLLFALAPDVSWVFAGRALMGVGVGLSLSPATAAMVEFSALGQAKRASSITTAATALGLALATLVGGALIQYAPFPTHLNFWVLFVVIAVVIGAAWFLPRHTRDQDLGRWRPRLPGIPRGLRKVFIVSAVSVTAAFATGAVMMSLGDLIAANLIGSDNSLVNGSSFALFAVAVGVVAIAARGLSAPTIIVLGGAFTTLGMGLLLLSAEGHSLGLFLATSVVLGAGYSLLFLGGLTVISANAPAHHRAGTLSAVYLVAYLMQGVTASVLGAFATASGLQVALDIGAPAIVVIGLGALALAVSIGRRPTSPKGSPDAVCASPRVGSEMT
jgi:MFS family permease